MTMQVKRNLFILDAGHGGSDVGVEFSPHKEKELTLKVTTHAANRLRSLANVVLLRTTDTLISDQKRNAMIDSEYREDLKKRSICIGFHMGMDKNTKPHGFSPSPSRCGFVIRHSKGIDPKVLELASTTMTKWYEEIGINNDPKYREEVIARPYYLTNMQSLMIEIGFISHYETMLRFHTAFPRFSDRLLMDIDTYFKTLVGPETYEVSGTLVGYKTHSIKAGIPVIADGGGVRSHGSTDQSGRFVVRLPAGAGRLSLGRNNGHYSGFIDQFGFFNFVVEKKNLQLGRLWVNEID